MSQVSKEMRISDIIQLDQGLIPVLMASGMYCIGCPAAQAESLEDAAMVHGIPVDELVERLNEYLVVKSA